MLKNIAKKLESVKLNRYYSPYFDELVEVARMGLNEDGKIGAMFNLFKFGYMQGHKAAISEAKKKINI